MSSALETQWIRSSGLPPRILLFGGMLIVVSLAVVGAVAASVGGAGVAQALELSPSGSIGAATTGVVWAFGIVAPIILVLVMVSTTEVRIGLGTEGIELVSRLRRRRLRWDQLWPSYPRTAGRWLMVCYRTDEHEGLRYFWATKEQARALASHPKAPYTLFPAEVRDWLSVAPPPAA